MKKLLLTMCALVVVSLVSCNNQSKDHPYKVEGEKLAAKLDSLCKANDSVAAMALDDSIRAREAAIVAEGDSTAIRDFRLALKESRQRNAPYLTRQKVEAGASKEEAVTPLVNDVLSGEGDITTVTNSINEAIRASEGPTEE